MKFDKSIKFCQRIKRETRQKYFSIKIVKAGRFISSSNYKNYFRRSAFHFLFVIFIPLYLFYPLLPFILMFSSYFFILWYLRNSYIVHISLINSKNNLERGSLRSWSQFYQLTYGFFPNVFLPVEALFLQTFMIIFT